MLRVASVVLGLLVALVLAELLARVLYAEKDVNVVFLRRYQLSENPVLGYELMPGSPDYHTTINSDGIRDREFPLQKPTGTFRIVVIGDSVSFGYLLTQDATYPKQLESLLNRHAKSDGIEFEVINLGVIGYNITQTVENARTRGLRYDPDLIIYGYVLNEPQAYSMEADALRLLKRRAETGFSETTSDRIVQLLHASRLISLILAQVRSEDWYHRIPRLGDPGFFAHHAGTHREFFRDLHSNPQSWKRVTDGLAALAHLTNQPRNIPAVVALFPIHEGHGFSRYALGDLHEKVIGEAVKQGLRTIDLTDVFQRAYVGYDKGLFVDFMHPSAKGNQVAAMALFQWLSERGLLPQQVTDFSDITDWNDEEAKIAGAISTGK